jgi:hypothetical protein
VTDAQTWTQTWTLIGLFFAVMTATTGLLLRMVRAELAVVLARFDGRFDAVEGKFALVNARFDAVDARFDAVDARLDNLDRDMHAVVTRLMDS